MFSSKSVNNVGKAISKFFFFDERILRSEESRDIREADDDGDDADDNGDGNNGGDNNNRANNDAYGETCGAGGTNKVMLCRRIQIIMPHKIKILAMINRANMIVTRGIDSLESHTEFGFDIRSATQQIYKY